MSTTYDYNYDYEPTDVRRRNRTEYAPIVPPSSRSNPLDPLTNLQHDRIWTKLYDPLDTNRISHQTEIQKMARRQDRRVIKIEASYGSDRQTFIVKRGYDLRVRDVQEDAAKTFRMPVDQIILYWKGRNICETPNELLEILGVENNHQMRVCRSDDQAQRERQRQNRSNSSFGQSYSNSTDPYYYLNNSTNYDATPRGGNYYQQLTSPSTTFSGPIAATYVVNVQVGFGDRVEGLAVGRPHPITIYDLQVELQQRFNIPVLEQNASYNGMSLTQFPPDSLLETLGIVNNSFISLWYKTSNDIHSTRQTMPMSYYNDLSQTARDQELSPRRIEARNSNVMDSMSSNNVYPEVLKIEVFHGSERHLLILRSSNNLRINDLMDEIQRISTVPVFNQKLYFRGQELHLMKEKSLREVGVDNNAQIRLIGEPTKRRYEPIITAHRTD